MARSRGGEGPDALALQRREFLALGSAGLLSLCFGDLALAQQAGGGAAVPRPMRVGFIAGSEWASTLRRLPTRIRRPRMVAQVAVDGIEYSVLPADSLLTGDTDLIGRPLRLSVHGLYPPGGITPRREAELPWAIDLDVLFPSPDPVFPDPIPFFAWSFRRWPGWNPSPPVSFIFPLDWQALPELRMRVLPADGGPDQVFQTRFTFDQEAGQPRLQRGVYALGTTANAWRREVPLRNLGPDTPASLVSVLLSVEPEGEE